MRIPPWIALRFLLAQLTRISNLEQANIFLDLSSTVTTFWPREANHGDVAYHPDIIRFSHSIISVIFLKILDQSRIFIGSGSTVAMLRSLDSPRFVDFLVSHELGMGLRNSGKAGWEELQISDSSSSMAASKAIEWVSQSASESGRGTTKSHPSGQLRSRHRLWRGEWGLIGMRTKNSGNNENKTKYQRWKQNGPTKATFQVSIHGLKQVKRS